MQTSMDGQDWNTVRIQGAKVAKPTAKAPAKNTTPDVAAQRGLEQQETAQKPKTLSTESRTQIMQMRAAMKKTQVELNQMCQFPANTVNGIESGKIIPSQSQLVKLNRVLGAKLQLN
jgi:ribosome-binding protein aMBF1 (putative translation factor)